MTKKPEKKSFFFLAILGLALLLPNFSFANRIPIPSSGQVYNAISQLMRLDPCTSGCQQIRNRVREAGLEFRRSEEPFERIVDQINRERQSPTLSSAALQDLIDQAGPQSVQVRAAATQVEGAAKDAKEAATRASDSVLPEKAALIPLLDKVEEKAKAAATGYGTTTEQLTNIRNINRLHEQRLRSVDDPAAGRSSGCGWCTGAGIAAGAAVLVGGGYVAGNMMIKDAGKEGRKTVDYAEAAAGRVVDSSLDKVEARTAKILADSTKTAQDFINSQITRLRGEVQGLARDGVMALEREVYAAIDRLIENATRQADSVLLAKLQQLRTEAQNFFNEILSNANNFLEQNGVGDFRIDDVEIFNSPATDLERRLQSAVNTAKATGKTGAALQAVCLSEGAKIFNKTDPAALSSAERTAILNLCK